MAKTIKKKVVAKKSAAKKKIPLKKTYSSAKAKKIASTKKVEANIIVLVDFSEATKNIIQQASVFADKFKSKLWLIYVGIPHPDLKGHDSKSYTKLMRQQMAKIYHKEHCQLQSYASDLRKKGIETTALLVQGNPAEMVLKEASKLGADFIVMGSHGHGALHKALLGSVSEGILKETTCPLVIVPRGKRYKKTG